MQSIESTYGQESGDGVSDATLTACLCSTEPFMLVSEAASVLRVSRSYLYTGLREGRFPGLIVGDNYRLRRNFIHRFINAPAGTRFEDYAAEWMAREATAVAS